MKERFGERRAAPRYDIVGLLKGTVETRQHHHIHNISPLGALLETSRMFEVGMRVTGRISEDEAHSPARGDIRWVAPHGVPENGGRYLVGVAWIDPPPAVDMSAGDRLPDESERAPGGRERRAAPRRSCPDHSIFDVAVTSTVTVMDVSACGVFFSSSTPIETGAHGCLSMHLGGDNFTGNLEIRRTVKHQGARPDWGVGAAFTSLADRSRQTLATLLQRKM